jgi:glycosyltransferase involved in cell wall biosynthesis
MHPPGDPGFEQLTRKAERWGAKLISVPDRGPLDLSILPRLLKICRNHRVSIYHAHDYKSNVLGLWLKRRYPMRMMTTIHGWVQRTWRTPLYYALDRWSLPSYEKVICVSQDLRETCLAAGVRADRCVLLDNAIDTEEFRRRRSRTEARQELGLPSTGLVIGGVGRLSAEKGFDLLIRAVRRLLDRGLDVSLAIAGEGDERSRLQKLAQELSLGDRVRLLGYCSDMRPVFEALDVFALSSLREGLPNVLLEALAMETPAVCTRIAGVPRLVQDGVTGLLVMPGSANELSDGLARMLNDEHPPLTMCASSGELIESEFSFAVRMRKLAAIYDDMPG